MGKGIISCGLKVDNIYERDIKIGDIVYMEKGKKYTFFLNGDKKYFDVKNQDLQSVAKNAKWAYIMNSFFDSAVKKKSSEIYTEWGSFNKHRGEKAITYLGINDQYKHGDSIEFYFNDSTSLWIGTGYRVEVFSTVPNDGLHFTIVTAIEKYVQYGFFLVPSREITISDIGVSDGLLSYGATTMVEISLHRYGISKLDPDIKPKLYNLELYLTDEFGKLLSDKAFLTENLSKYVSHTGEGHLNNGFRVPFVIDETWKKDYHEGTDYKNYSIEIRVLSINDNTYSASNIVKKNYSIVGNSGNDEHNVRYLTQNYFSVKKSASDLMNESQSERNNMIQYIGDVDYSYREFDPCGYSKISIKELSQKERTVPYIIFEEGKTTVTDKTKNSFDILAGGDDDDKKAKQVEIKVEDLTRISCQSIMLQKGKKHNDLRYVFQTDRIWTAKPIKIVTGTKVNAKELYKVEIDKTAVNQDRRARIENEKSIPVGNKDGNNYEGQDVLYQEDAIGAGEKGPYYTDYDLVADRKIDGAGIQEWIDGEDYEIKDNGNSATFLLKKLKYYYDKTPQSTDSISRDKSTIAEIKEDILNNLWMFNYFWLSQDLAQTYFLPVSTCRYPNQIAIIRVLPDIEWDFKLELSSTVPEVSSHTNIPAGKEFEKYQKKAKEAGNNKRFLNADVSFELAIKAKTDGFEREISVGYEQKIKSILESLISVKKKLDNVTGAFETEKGMAGKIATKFPGSMSKFPFTFELDYPVISIIGNWKLETVNNKPGASRSGKIEFGLTPLIKGEGKFDVLAAAQYLPVVGPAFKAALTIKDAINNYTPLTADIWLNLLAFGQIDLKGTILIDNEETGVQLDSSTTVGVGAELGVKAGANLPKITFRGSVAPKADIGFEIEASAKGATSVIFNGKGGITDKGIYIELGMSFGGMTVLVTGKVKAKLGGWGSLNAGKEDMPYELLEPIPDLLNGRHYFVEIKK